MELSYQHNEITNKTKQLISTQAKPDTLKDAMEMIKDISVPVQKVDFSIIYIQGSILLNNVLLNLNQLFNIFSAFRQNL